MSTDSLAPLFHDFTDWLDAYNGRCQGNYSSFYRGGYDLTHANLEVRKPAASQCCVPWEGFHVEDPKR